MELQDFKKEFVRSELSIDENYGKIFSFIDFGNVNNWFAEDRQDWENRKIADNEKINIDIDKLKEFTSLFSEKIRCYYGKDPKNKGSIKFNYALEKVFGKHNFVSKDIQKIKHYIGDEDVNGAKIDKNGDKYIEIRKCNFDVELSVDALKKIKHYDTFCLFSGDADFVYLNNHLRKRGKKIILIKAGNITTLLRESANIVINAQNIKKNIAQVKQKPD